MKIKSYAAALLAAALAASAIMGCAAKNGEDKDSNEEKGKYVEQQIELPFKDTEEIISLEDGGDKGYLLFTKVKSDGTYKGYSYKDGQFTDEDASWLNETGGAGENINKVIVGEDGNFYALYTDADVICHISKKTEEGAREIEIPDLRAQGEMNLYPFVYDFNVDKEGNLFLALPVTGQAVMYDQNTGDKIRSFDSAKSMGVLALPMDVKDGRIILGSTDGSGLTVYDTASGEEVSNIMVSDLDLSGVIRLGDDQDCYYADAKGLHHFVLGGSVSEDIIEGEGTAFATPKTSVMGFLDNGEKEYTMLFCTAQVNGYTYQIVRYTYDKNASTKPAGTLSVYGLTESDAVRQAIVKYQQDHPDVKVDYKTGNTGEGTETKADSIRALNTELLGGSGADVLMLDGLPVDSYMEKGILASLDDVLEEAEKDSNLSGNIIEPYKKDGKIYQIPTRYGIPILAGNSEKSEALKTADKLKDYMDSNEGAEIMNDVDRETFMGLLANINYKDIVDKDQKINTELLAELMETAGKLEDANGEIETGQVYEYGARDNIQDSGWDAGSPMDITDNDTVASQELLGIQGMMMPYNYLRKAGLEPADINGTYVPHDIAGINNASENKELAEDFIRTLLSEDVQAIDVEGGFPVNEDAWDAYVQSVESSDSGMEMSVGVSVREDGESESEAQTISLPLKSEVESLKEMGRSLKMPLQKDEVIGAMILDGAKTYFDGSQTAEEAAADVARKADTYLSE